MKKIRLISLTLVVMTSLCWGSCNSYSPIKDLESFSSELEANSANYTVEEWKEAFQIYEGIVASMEGVQLTDEETREFGRINGVCTGYLARGAVVIAKDASSTGLTFLDGLVDGFSSTFDEEFFEDVVDSLEEGIESIIDNYE